MAFFYERQLLFLGVVCSASLLVDKFILHKTSSALERESRTPSVVSGLSRRYLLVYAIVMGADWLQGPYIYSLYREQHKLPEHLVALLFVLGFLTAGVAAPLVGVWADQYGRKRMCMTFCLAYAAACALIQVSSLPVLFCGRLLGGFSTAILFSCFDSWLVASANNLSLSSRDLSTILGRAALVNSMAAALAGVASNQLVERSGLYSSTFLASGALLLLGWVTIAFTWSENYGLTVISISEMLDRKPLAEAWRLVCADKRLLVVGVTQTCFEGSMYLFVFIWVPLLEEAVPHTPNPTFPLGYIFSSFMISMTLGSIVYTSIVSLSNMDVSPPPSTSSPPNISGSSTDASHVRVIALHARLSAAVCTAGALTFVLSAVNEREHVRFWSFCAYEACVGMYYPVQGMLRGRLVSDEHRATLSSLFRVPLNVFVVVALMTGVSSARRVVLLACAGLLLFSALVTAIMLLHRTRGPSLASLRTR